MIRKYPVGIQNFEDLRKEGFRYYTLGFPNKEVEEGFTKFLLPHYAHLSSVPFASDSRKLFKIGVNFSNATRGIEKWLIEEK